MNPCSIVSLYGRVTEDPHYLKDKKGTEFALRMKIAVKRNYRNRDGEYQEDLIPVKYKYEERLRSFAHEIKPGDRVSLSGTIRSEAYQGKNLIYVLADAISFDEMTRARKYSREGTDDPVSAEFELDLPLPL